MNVQWTIKLLFLHKRVFLAIESKEQISQIKLRHAYLRMPPRFVKKRKQQIL